MKETRQAKEDQGGVEDARAKPPRPIDTDRPDTEMGLGRGAGTLPRIPRRVGHRVRWVCQKFVGAAQHPRTVS